MNKGVVIIGAGHAGVQAAASLRDEGYDGKITLIGDEAELPYHKPPLSKTFIKDPEARPQILRAEAFYSGANIELVTGQSVEALDLADGKARLASGAAIPFDRAILATGARPRAAHHLRRAAGRRAVAALHCRRPRHSRPCRRH